MLICKQSIFRSPHYLVQNLMKAAAVLLVLSLTVLQAACDHLPMPNNAEAYTGPGVRVMAAGLLRGDGAHSGPVYNNLKISAVNTGELVMIFDGYRMPDEQLQYVVKVMPVNATTRASLLSIYFIEYMPEGIRLNVRRGNANLSVADLQAAQFMIEVSAIQ